MILLDTHVVLWQELDDSRLGPQTRRTIEDAMQEGMVTVSAITFWEVGMRVQKGQLDLGLDLHAWRRNLLEEGLLELAIDGEIAVRAGLLSNMHGDPADRIIVATALNGHQLVTADRRILDWPGHLDQAGRHGVRRERPRGHSLQLIDGKRRLFSGVVRARDHSIEGAEHNICLEDYRRFSSEAAPSVVFQAGGDSPADMSGVDRLAGPAVTTLESLPLR